MKDRQGELSLAVFVLVGGLSDFAGSGKMFMAKVPAMLYTSNDT